jgi:hypothetical protein
MKVDRKELRDILATLKPGLGKKEFVQQACHFIFMEDMIVTYNGQMLITHPYKCDEPFSVKGEEFFRLIDGIPDESITLSLKDKQLKIITRSTTASLATISEEENKIPKTVESLKKQMKNWNPLPKDFCEAVGLCAFSASPDLTAAKAMACVSVQDNICKSRDISRASMFIMSSPIKDHLLIWSKEAIELAKFPVKEYCWNKEKWVHFRTGNDVTFTCQSLKAEHSPKMVEVLDSFNQYEHFELPGELKSAIDSIFVLAHDILDLSGKFLEVRFEDEEIFIKADNDLGWVQKNLRCSYKGKPITIGINAKFLSQILERATKVVIRDEQLHFSSGTFQHLLTQAPRKEV